MRSVIVLSLFILLFKYVLTYGLLSYDENYIEYDMRDSYYTSFYYYENTSYIKRDIPPFEFNCNKNIGQYGVCRIDFNETMKKNLYGLMRACQARTTDDESYGCSNLIEKFPKAINVEYSGKPPTSGGLITITGDYLRANVVDLTLLVTDYNAQLRGVYFPIVNSYKDPSYDPRKLIVNFTEGYGYMKFTFDRTGDYIHNLTYDSPSISSIEYDGSTLIVNGNNFYKNTTLLTVVLKGEVVDISKLLISKPHTVLRISHQELYPTKVDINITVGGISMDAPYIYYYRPNPFNILPNHVSISKYNSGIITINGTLLSSSNGSNGNVSVWFVDDNNNNYICNVNLDESSSTKVSCNLDKGQGKVTLMVAVDGIENENSNVTFTYGIPNIDTTQKATQNGTEFTIYGINFGNLDDNSTVVYISNVNETITITSISSDETKLSFHLPYVCSSTVSVSLLVNGIKSNTHSITPQSVYSISSSSPSTKTGSSIGITKFYSCTTKIGTTYITLDDSANQIPCELNLTNNTAICNVGSGTGTHKIKVYVAGVQQIDSTFKYGPPVVTSYKIDEVIVSNKTLLHITLFGFNFGNSNDSSKFAFKLLNNSFSDLVVDDHETISFNVESYFDDYVEIVVDSVSIDNNYLIKLFKIGSIVENQSNRSTRNGNICISGTNLPDISSLEPSSDTASINITSFVDGGPSNYKGFNISNNLITVLLEDGIGRFNVSITINNASTKYLTSSYSKPVIIDIPNQLSNDVFEFNITGINFGKPFSISFTAIKNQDKLINNNCTYIQPGYYYNCRVYNHLLVGGFNNQLHNVSLILDDTRVEKTIDTQRDKPSSSNNKAVKISLGVVLPVAAIGTAAIICFIKKDKVAKLIDGWKNKSNSNV